MWLPFTFIVRKTCRLDLSPLMFQVFKEVRVSKISLLKIYFPLKGLLLPLCFDVANLHKRHADIIHPSTDTLHFLMLSCSLWTVLKRWACINVTKKRKGPREIRGVPASPFERYLVIMGTSTHHYGNSGTGRMEVMERGRRGGTWEWWMVWWWNKEMQRDILEDSTLTQSISSAAAIRVRKWH